MNTIPHHRRWLSTLACSVAAAVLGGCAFEANLPAAVDAAPDVVDTAVPGDTAVDSADTAPDTVVETSDVPEVEVAQNHPPVANGSVLTVPENGSAPAPLDASDPDGDPLTATIVTPPAHGALSGTYPSLTYTPTANYDGPDGFDFRVSDGHLDSGTAHVAITVTNTPRCGDGAIDAGEDCDDENTVTTDGCVACQDATCGDGFVRAGVEDCDDQNDVATDGCIDCQAATCGDGFIEAGVETCDDQDEDTTDDCVACQQAKCGDGAIQAGVETCDDENDVATDGCVACQKATCGDGFIEAGVETCDDKNDDATDDCIACQKATCGDGFIEAGVETCDDHNGDTTDDCVACHDAKCGDGFIKAGVEECDDGAANGDTAACLTTCAKATCGDGFVQAGVEECDDHNTSDTDDCVQHCKSATCGDGFRYVGHEQCDDGDKDNTNGCVNTCLNAYCGDGFTRVGFEECDDENPSNTDACLNTCVAATCGDGFVEAGEEECDDVNVSDTDHCLTSCVEAICGDGVVEAGVEQCDDGDDDNQDGCRNDCTIPVCGDGTVDAGEECEDGDTDDDDGCGSTCKVERCGDGMLEYSRGEECDDGKLIGGDGCDATCLVETVTTTTSVLVSAGLSSCSTGVASSARRIAVSGNSYILVGFACGAVGYVSTSVDRGQTFSAPFKVSLLDGVETQLSQIGVAMSATNHAYVVLLLTSGQIVLRESEDLGATWGPALPLGTASNTSSGVSIQAFNEDIYVAWETSTGVTIAHALGHGTKPFAYSLAPLTTADFDMNLDYWSRTVAVTASSPPSFRMLISNDRGQTFGGEVNPPGQQFFSDWGMNHGIIATSGTNIGILGNSTQLYVIPTSNPGSSTAISGLPQVTTLQSRSVAVSDTGAAFVASQRDAGTIQLDRLQFGAAGFDAARAIPGNGTQPHVAPLYGGRGAAIAYTQGGNTVWVTVQAY